MDRRLCLLGCAISLNGYLSVVPACLGEAFDVISAAILSPLRLYTSHEAILCKTYVICVL